MRILLGLSAILYASAAQADEFTVYSEPTSAVITPAGGFVTRDVAVDMPAGKHVVTVYGVPYFFDYGDLSISMPENSELLSWSFEEALESESNFESSDEYIALKGAVDVALANLQAHQSKVADQQAVIEAARIRISFLNSIASGQSDVLSLETVNDPQIITTLSTQLGSEATQANLQMRQAERAMLILQDAGVKLMQSLENAQEELQAARPPKRNELVLTLDIASAAATQGLVKVSYIEPSMNWRIESVVELDQDAAKGALSIKRNAVIQQQSGEHWKDVSVRLSTADISQGLKVDIPNSLIRRLYDPEERQDLYSKSSRAKSSANQDFLAEPVMEEAVAAGSGSVLGQSVELAGQTLIFDIQDTLDIKSQSTLSVVPLDAISLDVDLHARATATHEKAFLYADITNVTGGAMLPSKAYIYRDGVYFGQTQLPAIVAGDEYSLELGILDGIQVEHNILKREDGDSGILSSSSVAQSRFSTLVTSFLDYDLPVRIYDRMPVSESEDLEVKPLGTPTASERDVEGRRGVLAWHLDMEAGSKQEIKFGYDLKWPANMAVE